jgi:hypothetical protein
MKATVGPLPASVYWRRRAVILGVVLLLALTVKACLSGGGGGGSKKAAKQSTQTPFITRSSSSSSASPTPSATPSGQPTATASSGGQPSQSSNQQPGGGTCGASDLDVTASTDAKTYRVGAMPKLTITVRNKSNHQCSRDLSVKAVEFRIVSGADRIWSSVDCPPATGASTVVLAPGQEQTVTQVWGGHRSSSADCTNTPQAKAGYYRLVGIVGPAQGAAAFQLMN